MLSKTWALALALALAAAPVSLALAAGGAGGAGGGGRCCRRRVWYGHRLSGGGRGGWCGHFFNRAGRCELRGSRRWKSADKSDGLDRLYDG